MEQEKREELPIELKIYTSNSPSGESIERARQCAFMAEGLFLIMAKVCKDAAFADRTVEPNPMPETLVAGLAYMSELGVALLTACTEYIDKMEFNVIAKSRAAKTGGSSPA